MSVSSWSTTTSPTSLRCTGRLSAGSAAGHLCPAFCRLGEDALAELANGVRPALIVILSDINMLGMDGLSLLREIKRPRPDLPAMIVTAYGDAERRRRAEEAGAFQCLTKPVDFDFLKEQLRQLGTPPGAER